MTPLAALIAKEFTLPLKKRTLEDDDGIIRRAVDDIHCFEVSEIMPLAFQMVENFREDSTWPQKLMFLPAPKTWIEWKNGGARRAFLLEQPTVLSLNVKCTLVQYDSFDESLSFDKLDDDLDCGKEWFGKPLDEETPSMLDDGYSTHCMVGALLALINSPRIVGRKQNMPNAGLQRQVAKSRGMVGKFPLHAWTEIQLHIGPPKDMSGNSPVEAHLSGHRALHFCRAHLRVRFGKLEIVSSHWRGDPSLGIKQSRYSLCA